MKQVTDQKVRGAHFTPHELACFVARRIIKTLDVENMDAIRVLDPACGDGELLLAFAKTFSTNALNKTTMIGVETNIQAIETARVRLVNTFAKQIILQRDDFLDVCEPVIAQQQLFFNTPKQSSSIEPVNIIIANPPYVRTQVLGAAKAQALATAFGLSGRVDLYHAFLVAMTRQLLPGGVLGVITSNRFLTTQGGSAIREFLAREYEIIEIIDLGDTKLFDAAVLPAIFIGRKRLHLAERKKTSDADATFVRIYENTKIDTSLKRETKHSIYEALEDGKSSEYTISGQHYTIAHGTLSLPISSNDPWNMVTLDEDGWLKTIDAHSATRISDVAKVRVGIKTTADEVFIRDDWHKLPVDIQPEENILRRLLSQENANRWMPKTKDVPLRQVLYTHTMKNEKRVAIDLTKYPKAEAYLKQHYVRLISRTYVVEAKRQWYEIWVPQQPSAWQQPKLVFPDISPSPKFSYDEQGCIVDGNCYWIVPNINQSSDILFLIAGIANSNLMTRYHDLAFNNKLYAGRRRYLTQYVEKYPLPDPSSRVSQNIVALVKELIFCSLSAQERVEREQNIEILVAQAFEVEPLLNY